MADSNNNNIVHIICIPYSFTCNYACAYILKGTNFILVYIIYMNLDLENKIISSLHRIKFKSCWFWKGYVHSQKDFLSPYHPLN